MISDVPGVQGLLQEPDLLVGEGDALPHLDVVGGPLPDVVLGSLSFQLMRLSSFVQPLDDSERTAIFSTISYLISTIVFPFGRMHAFILKLYFFNKGGCRGILPMVRGLMAMVISLASRMPITD